jgi:hypothetical protein
MGAIEVRDIASVAGPARIVNDCMNKDCDISQIIVIWSDPSVESLAQAATGEGDI